MRISDWAVNYKISVKPSEARPDNPTGDVVYRVKDIFTTRDGSWEQSDKPGVLPQWARDTYLRPFGAPDYFDDAGGDHHLFARVLDSNGAPVKSHNLVRYWSDGFDKLSDPNYQNYVHMTPKDRSGWANLVMFNTFNPDRGETGAWCWCPEGASDVVVGGGMPNKLHVSFFVVWQAEPRQIVPPVTPPGGGGNPPPAPTDFDELRRAVWGLINVTFNRDSLFANYARVHNLGAPLTNESDFGGYRVQGFAQGIVYAPIGQWNNVGHMSW